MTAYVFEVTIEAATEQEAFEEANQSHQAINCVLVREVS